MSVLFKALQRAEKARGGEASDDARPASMAESAPQGMPALGLRQRPRAGRGRMLVRALGVSFIIMLGSTAGAMVLFGDEVERAIETLVIGGPPPMPRPLPPVAAVPPPEATPETPPPAAPAPELPAAAPPPETLAAVPETPAGAVPGTLDPGTTDIAQLMAAARAVRGPEAPLEASPQATPDSTPTPAPTPVSGERGGPVPLVGLDAPQVTDLPPEDLAGESPDPEAPDPEAPVLPPEPRTLEEIMAERRRIDQARALAPSVVVDRPEAQRAGTANVVNVDLPTLRTRDTVAEAYRALLRGDYHSALASYDTVLDEDPRSLQALLGRAASLHKLRRLDDARHAYERVLAIESGNREALTNLLAILGAAAPKEALDRLQALERAAPDFTPVLAQIGLVYGQLGLDGQAVGYLQRAVAQDPGNLPYRYNLAILLDRSGQRQAAAEAYRAVLDGLRAGSGSGDLAVSADGIKARLDFLIAAR